ncbi:MAG: hypothetical protein KDC92_07970 [Bacteroidetes bacterium]|nr:hypothetical protein [Bacteroidota bacterium]
MTEAFDTKLTVQVEYTTSENANKVLINKPTSELDVHVKGNGWELLGYKLNPTKAKFEIDLDNIERSGAFSTQGVKSIILSQIPGLSQIRSIWPEEIYLEFESLIEKKVPISLPEELPIAQGFGIASSIIVTPDSLAVKGPKSVIENITKHKVMWPANLGLLNKSQRVIIPLTFNGKYNATTTKEIRVAFTIDQLSEMSFNLGIEVKKSKKNILLIPAKTKVKFLVPISLYETIKPQMFSPYVELPTLNTEDLLPVLIKTNAPFVQNISLQPEFVNYIIAE